MSVLVNVANPPDNDFETGVPPSTAKVTFPVGVPVVAETVTVTLALASYVIVGALMLVVVAITVLNVAVTDLSSFIATTQEPVPEHAPPQPTKTDPESAVGVRVTFKAGTVMV